MEKVERPWGWYINVKEEKECFKIKHICVYPGKRLSLQSHFKRSEHWVMVKGTGKVTVGKDDLILPKETLHRIENIGNENLEFVETQIGNYLEEDDIVRYEDDFGRL